MEMIIGLITVGLFVVYVVPVLPKIVWFLLKMTIIGLAIAVAFVALMTITG